MKLVNIKREEYLNRDDYGNKFPKREWGYAVELEYNGYTCSCCGNNRYEAYKAAVCGANYLIDVYGDHLYKE